MLYATIWQDFVAVDTGLETICYHSDSAAHSAFDYDFGIFTAILDFTFGKNLLRQQTCFFKNKNFVAKIWKKWWIS